MDISTVLTANEAATVLGVSSRTVTRMAIDGRLHAAKLSGTRGAYLFEKSEVETMAAKVSAK